MRTYVIEENIRRFQALLTAESSPERRSMLERLLHEEEAKLAAIKADGAAPGSDGRDHG